MSEKRVINDSTVARIAGNIASGIVSARPECDADSDIRDAQRAVGIARAIVAEVERTSEAKEADRA